MRKVSWTIVLQTISRHSYTWEMSSMKISIFTEKEEGRKNSCQYSQINHPQCQDRNPIVVLPFGSLMRHILKQPSNTTKFECFSHVVKSDSEYSRARWLIKEGQKRRAHDPPCIIVTKISALFAIFLSPQTHDLFVMHHIIDHPPQGICETLVSASTHEHRTNSYRSGLAPVTVQIESRHLLIFSSPARTHQHNLAVVLATIARFRGTSFKRAAKLSDKDIGLTLMLRAFEGSIINRIGSDQTHWMSEGKWRAHILKETEERHWSERRGRDYQQNTTRQERCASD